MKLAYLILGHAHPEQMVRMMDALRPTASAFVVHIDARSPQAVEDAVRAYAARAGDVFFAPRQRCYWGSYGIVAATLSCIRTLLGTGIGFEYAALVSGQDYPVATPAEFEAFFAARPGAEFVEAFPLAKPNRWTAHTGRFQAENRVLDFTLWWRSRTFSVGVRRRFYAGWEAFGGSQWWCLSRGAVEWVDGYVRDNPGVERYFRNTFIPDEAMIQTLVANSPFAGRISAETLTYIDWERPNPKYPRTLDAEDVGRVIGSGKLFARKVHPEVSKEWMDGVDRELERD